MYITVTPFIVIPISASSSFNTVHCCMKVFVMVLTAKMCSCVRVYICACRIKFKRIKITAYIGVQILVLQHILEYVKGP